MSAPTARIEVEQWRTPEVAARPSRMRAPGALRRSLTLLLVLGLHAFVALQIALPALQAGRPPTNTEAPVMVTTFIDATSMAIDPPQLSPIRQEAAPALELPPPTRWPDIPAGDAEVEAAQSNEFAPPRLRDETAPEPNQFASRAGIAISKAARVILKVTVTELGTAGDVAVAISSGDSKLDSIAIEYVRALRWEPAIVQGRESSMNIRLPVVFTVTG